MELVINDRIRQRKVDFFNEFNLSLKYNSIASTFSFSFYYDPDILEQKEMACVGHYHICKLIHNGELLMTGYILSEAFSDTPVRHLVPISGYSIPGVLEDCQIPTNAAIDQAIASGNIKLPKGTPIPYCYPIQDNGITLRQIATKYLAPFQIEMVVDDAVSELMDEAFPDISAKPKDSIKSHLTDLATQKNINLTHDRYGRVVFTKANVNLKPVLEFNVPRGGLPGIKMDLQFNGQQMHSHITVMKQADIDDENAGESTLANPFVPYVFRPKTIIQSAGSDIDTDLAVRKALTDELRNLHITIAIDRWDINGKLIYPASVITVINPDIYLFKKTTLFIESIDYSGNQKEMKAVLNCVLPEVYNDENPQYIFKGINTH